MVHRWGLPDLREGPPTFFGHHSWLDHSGDGRHIYAVDDAGQLEVRSVVDGRVIAATRIPDRGIRWVKGSSETLRVLFGLEEGDTYLCDFAAGGSPVRLGSDYAAQWTVDAQANWGGGVSRSGLRVRRFGSNAASWVLPSQLFNPSYMVFDPSGEFLAEVGDNGQTAVWSIEPDGPPTPAFSISAPGNALAAAFGRNGSRIATAGEDGTISVRSLPEGELLGEFTGSDRPISALAYAQDGSMLVSVDSEYTVRLWGSGDDLQVVPHPQRPGFTSESYVYSVCFGSTGRRIYTLSWGQGVQIFDAATALPVGQLASTTDCRMVGFAVHPDETLVAVAKVDSGLEVFDLRTGDTIATLDSRYGMMSFSPDGRRLAAVLESDLRVWDTADWSCVDERPGFGGGRIAALYSPDGRILAVTKGTGIVLFDAKRLQQVATLRHHTQTVECLAFSADSTRLATRATHGELLIWSVADPNAPPRALPGDYHVKEMAWGRDGRLLLAGMDGVLRVYDPEQGAELVGLTGHTDYIHSVAVDPQGLRVVTGSGDTTVRIWETAPLRDRFQARRRYEATAAQLGAHVGDLVDRLGAIEAIRVVGDEPGRSAREREIAVQLCIARALQRR
ncbi:MAG: WD40 repeat domain-containing protein [Planctomycetota bacterium]